MGKPKWCKPHFSTNLFYNWQEAKNLLYKLTKQTAHRLQMNPEYYFLQIHEYHGLWTVTSLYHFDIFLTLWLRYFGTIYSCSFCHSLLLWDAQTDLWRAYTEDINIQCILDKEIRSFHRLINSHTCIIHKGEHYDNPHITALPRLNHNNMSTCTCVHCIMFNIPTFLYYK